jgi:molybdenum cofactor cytidylyltransferase
VLGAHADDVRALLEGVPVRFVVNDRFEEGQGTSLAAGIASLDDGFDAAVILLGDQPYVDPAVIDRVVGARRTGGASIVMALYGEERGHPVLFGREHFSALLALDGDEGGRDIIREHSSDVLLVPVSSPQVLPDIDTESDWIAMLEEHRS